MLQICYYYGTKGRSTHTFTSKGDFMWKFKRLVTIALAVLSVGIFTVPASAASSTPGLVSVSTTLNVRSAGNTSARIVGTLKGGAHVSILSTANGWDQISYNGKAAWISGKYVLTGKVTTVVSAAESQLGVPYKYGGATPYSAFDCSGLTMYAYGKAGISLPHSAAQQAKYGWAVSRYALRPGDLVFFDTSGKGTITHCGIYLGSNVFLNAQSGAGKVMKANLTTSYWANSFVTARRLIG